MAEYSRIARGSFISTGSAQAVYLPFAPDTVKLWNYSSFATPAQHGIPEAYWSSQMGQGFAAVKLFNATPVLTTGVVTANGISTFAAGQLLQYGPRIQIQVAAQSATPSGGTTFTVASNPFVIGDVVIFEGLYQSSTTGMAQICGMPFVVTDQNYSSTTFAINFNTNGSNFTSLSGSPAGAYVRKVLYPYLYEPGVAFIDAITLDATTATIQTTAAHNFVVGQTVGFRIPPVYGTVELNALPNAAIPGSPKYFYVTLVLSDTAFVIKAAASNFTAFNTNQPIASVPGLDFPQVFAVGDVNNGGIQYSGGALYPSPKFPTFDGVSSIGGPAIQGAFVNNTYSGFAIGAGSAVSDSSSVLVGESGDVIYYEAILADMTV